MIWNPHVGEKMPPWQMHASTPPAFAGSQAVPQVRHIHQFFAFLLLLEHMPSSSFLAISAVPTFGGWSVLGRAVDGHLRSVLNRRQVRVDKRMKELLDAIKRAKEQPFLVLSSERAA